MVNNCSDMNNNSGMAPSSRIPIATRAISHSVRRLRRLSDYTVLSVPVRPNGDDGNIVIENDVGTRLDGSL